MQYVDFHTHDRRRHEGVTSVVCVGPGDDWSGLERVTVGLHPWHVTESWRNELPRLRSVAVRPEVVALGECGLDRVRADNWVWQLPCLEAQLGLADELGMAVVLHCVRAADVLLPMLRGWRGRVVWHGFRGKPQLAEQVLRAGIELSFGPLFNVESLRLAYGERRMWLETDDSGVDIRTVYDRASRALSISPTDIVLPGTWWS